MTLGLIWLLACGDKTTDTTVEFEEDTSTESPEDSAMDIESEQPIADGCGTPQSATVEQRSMDSNEGRERLSFGCTQYV